MRREGSRTHLLLHGDDEFTVPVSRKEISGLRKALGLKS
jgi:DNA-binding LytR/AlgR family response regulator